MRFILLLICVFISCTLPAQMMPSYKMTKNYSARQLEDWLRKNVRPRYTYPADFNISTQINTGWKTIHDTRSGRSVVGYGTGRASDVYNVDAILDFQYLLGQAWAFARTEFRNSGGLFGGTTSKFALSRAFIGYHFTAGGPVILDAYLGRRSLLKLYNSQLIFNGHGDGVTAYFSYMPKDILEIRASSGVYINQSKPYWIFRSALFNIAKLGLYLDYIFIHWGRVSPTIAVNGIPFSYNVSQFLVGWEYKPQFLSKNIQVFAAMLLNSSAQINALSHGSREKTAGYVGFQIGTVKKQNDFSLQVQLQFCRLQAVPPWTLDGIGTGAFTNSIFTATSSRNVSDKTNFKGWEMIANYAITDDLTISGKLQRSVPMNKAIGPDFNYTTFKLETRYTF